MCRLLPSGGSFLSPDGVGVPRLAIGFQRSNTCNITSRDLLDDEEDAYFVQSYIPTMESTNMCEHVGDGQMLQEKQEDEFAGALDSEHVLERHSSLERFGRQMV
jgi:hypothetical protein